MTADREALEALQRRLGHAEAIAGLIAEPLDTPVGEALRGVALMLSDISGQLDEMIANTRLRSAASE
jgi:hypothetical protein